MKTNEFIFELVENRLDNNTIIGHVEDQESKYLELLHTELGFLSGLIIAINAGANVKKLLEKRILELQLSKPA